MNRQRSRWMCSICFFANLTASHQRRGVSWGCRCFSRGAAWQEQAGLLFPDSRMDGAPAHRRGWLQEHIRCYSAFTNAHNYVDGRLQPGYRCGWMANLLVGVRCGKVSGFFSSCGSSDGVFRNDTSALPGSVALFVFVFPFCCWLLCSLQV